MKSKAKIILPVLMLVFLIIATCELQASITETNLITISATLELQGETTNSGTITTYKSPVKMALGTKQILSFMAVDENAEDNYITNVFPEGAKLVEVDSTNGADYQVLDKSNNFLVDVSDIFYIEHSTNDIYYGNVSDSTGLNDPSVTAKYIVRYNYDDSTVFGGAELNFFLAGLASRTITDTKPNDYGTFKQTKLSSTPVAMGAGNYQEIPFVIIGSLTQTRTDIFTLEP